MEERHLTHELTLSKEELEPDHTCRSDHSLPDIWVGGGRNTLNSTVGM